jgi:DNA polymerase I-like protein with 3'-5' exonuclease and polymerase domains
MILQVHDELVLDVPTAEEHILTDIVRTCMESALQVHIPVCIPENWRNVPLRVDIHSGRDWVAAKG